MTAIEEMVWDLAARLARVEKSRRTTVDASTPVAARLGVVAAAASTGVLRGGPARPVDWMVVQSQDWEDVWVAAVPSPGPGRVVVDVCAVGEGSVRVLADEEPWGPETAAQDTPGDIMVVQPWPELARRVRVQARGGIRISVRGASAT